MSVPTTGFPAGVLETDSNTPSVPSGATTYLTEGTPFGALFGSSQDQQYINLAASAGGVPSTTTLAFEQPTPATGWGFALGDVDADMIQIEAVDADGNEVDASGIGWQGEFNYCGVTAAPPSCSGAGTDVPTWEPITMTLIGNGSDTSGAAGWFMPTVSLSSITLTFSVLSGIPSYQLWVADTIATISGTVTLLDQAGQQSPQEGAALRLLDSDGNPVLDAAGNPVTTTSAPDGTYSFPELARDSYQVAIDVPAGLELLGTHVLPADASSGDVSDVNYQLRVLAPPTPSPPPLPSPQPPAPPASAAPQPIAAPSTPPSQAPQLAATGTNHVTPLALTGLGLLTLGLLLITRARRHR